MDCDTKRIIAIRKRPITKLEKKHKQKDIIDILSQNSLIVKEKKLKVDLTQYTEKHNF